MADDPTANVDNPEVPTGDPAEEQHDQDTQPQAVDPEKAKLSRIAETQRKRARDAEAERDALKAKLAEAEARAQSKEEYQFEVRRVKMVMASGLGLDALDLCEGKTEEEVNSKIEKLRALLPAPTAPSPSPVAEPASHPAEPAAPVHAAPRQPKPVVDTKVDPSRMTPAERLKYEEDRIRNM